ncbi:MAG: AbrB/MazE/SpoVT family DNA-binding domain-containing protein [Alteraurantiacibacter sp.]
MTAIDLKVASNGRMVLPKAVREAMGLQGDTKVTAIVDEAGVRLVPMRHRVLRARELYQQAIKSPRSTKDFLRDRREEAERDEAPSGRSAA